MSQKLRGLVGQGMNGKRRSTVRFLAVKDTTAAGSDSFTATVSCVVELFAWSAGASGSAAAGVGGGGGAAGHKRIPLSAGQRISWTVGAGGAISGNLGGDTTVTLPTGVVLTLTGGGLGPGGAPSSGWDLGRRGGDGGAASVNGGSPTGGGTGGNGNASGGGGGGAAGFSDTVSGLPAGNGGVGNGAGQTAPGGGGGGTSGISGAGMDGRVYMVAVKVIT